MVQGSVTDHFSVSHAFSEYCVNVPWTVN